MTVESVQKCLALLGLRFFFEGRGVGEWVETHQTGGKIDGIAAEPSSMPHPSPSRRQENTQDGWMCLPLQPNSVGYIGLRIRVTLPIFCHCAIAQFCKWQGYLYWIFFFSFWRYGEKKLRTKTLWESLCVALVKISASLYRVNSRAYLFIVWLSLKSPKVIYWFWYMTCPGPDFRTSASGC